MNHKFDFLEKKHNDKKTLDNMIYYSILYATITSIIFSISFLFITDYVHRSTTISLMTIFVMGWYGGFIGGFISEINNQ